MNHPAYTLATYRVHAGREADFIITWRDLAQTFRSLPQSPVSGTLIRSTVDPTLFHSFGPWKEQAHVAAMRANPKAAQQAFTRLEKLMLRD